MEEVNANIKIFSLVTGSILLIAGTSIGGGMLILPIVTAQMGFFPSSLLFILTWLIMTFTAFLIVEASLNMPNTNLISMCKKTLGPLGEMTAWVSYLLLLYSLMAAYTSGASSLIEYTVYSYSRLIFSPNFISLLLIGIVVALVISGIHVIDRLNRAFTFLAGGCYVAMLYLLVTHFQSERLFATNIYSIAQPLPVLVTAFGFHIIIPSLTRYLNYDRRLTYMCLWIGSIVPLLFYLGWQLAILGTLPLHGNNGMIAILNSENQLSSLIHSLENITKSSASSLIASLFCGLAIVTSLLGVAISMWDFMKDGLSFSTMFSKKRYLSIATFSPPALLVFFLPNIFTSLLSYAGIFVAILLGILPIAMVWKGRKNDSWVSHSSVFGRKTAMIFALFFFIFVILIQLAQSI